jgi:transposase
VLGTRRRGFFELAELQKGPIAIEAVKRIDALLAIERDQRLLGRATPRRPQ